MKGNIKRGLLIGLNEMAEVSKELTPLDEGNLRGSTEVLVEEVNGNVIGEIILVAEYAIPVHENLNAFHLPPTKAKFLEDAVNEMTPNLVARVKAEAVV